LKIPIRSPFIYNTRCRVNDRQYNTHDINIITDIVFLYNMLHTVFYSKTLIYSNLVWSEVFYAETRKNYIIYQIMEMRIIICDILLYSFFEFISHGCNHLCNWKIFLRRECTFSFLFRYHCYCHIFGFILSSCFELAITEKFMTFFIG